MAEEGTSIPGLLVVLVLALLVLVGSYWFLFESGYSQKIKDSIPGFTIEERKIEWDRTNNLTYPGIIQYHIEGKNADIFLFYNTKDPNLGKGWLWNMEKPRFFLIKPFVSPKFQGYIPVGTGKLDSRDNQIFLRQLSGENADEGLRIIVERVIKDNNLKLHVTFTDPDNPTDPDRLVLDYDSSDKRLYDLNGLMIKFNQISIGLVEGN